jgi:cytoskeletal protein CcmA (bactofilin family)
MAWGSKSEGGAPPQAKGGMSFIGSEVTIAGNVSGQGDLHLDGTIEGDLACNVLILGSGGRVKGNIQAAKATVAGQVEGTVDARELLVEKTAKIRGDLSYESISIETGAQVDGRLTQRGGGADHGLKLVMAGD